MNNSNIRYILVALGTILLPFALRAQVPVANWQQVNTQGQDIPWSTLRMPDGAIVLSAIQSPTYFARQKLLMVKLNEEGKPTVKNEILLGDTSIVFTAGIFPYGNKGYIVFAAFAPDTPFIFAKQFGYVLLDSNFTLLKTQFINIGLHPLATIETANMKWDNTASEYYGMQLIYNTPGENPYFNYRYGNLLILDSLLTVQVSLADSHAIDSIHPNYFVQDIGYGNLCRFNDSLYHIIYSGGYFLGTTTRTFNRNSNIVINGTNAIFLSLAPPIYHALYLRGGSITILKHTDSTLLIASKVKQLIAPEAAEDTLLDKRFDLGQSVIAEVNPKTYWAYKYHLFEPWKLDSGNSSSYSELYYGGIANNFDKLYRNQLFYTRVLNDAGFTYYSGSFIKVTALNEKLIPKWTVTINDIFGDANEAPYNIVATSDSGCVLFTRNRVSLSLEPYFDNKKTFPVFDIKVYKLSNMGVVTGTYSLDDYLLQPQEVYVYPNPTSSDISFKNLQTNSSYQLSIYDILGNEVMQKNIDAESQLDVHEFKNGIYFYNLQSDKHETISGKFIVE